jgi:hypothetical protein
MKKLKLEHPTNRVLIFILVMILAVETALLGYLGLKTQILWNQIQGCASEQQQGICLSTFPTLDYVRDSINGLRPNEGVSDINGSKIYFPELKIFIPFSEEARALRYGYRAKSSDNVEMANFSTYNLMNRPIQKWRDIPCYQFLVGMTVDKADESYWQYPDLAATVKLKDGRTLYIYKNKLNGCGDVWAEKTPDIIVKILQQAQSY